MPRVNPTDGVRTALLRTLPGRAIVVGVAIKFAVALIGAAFGGVPPFLGVIETVASVAAVAGPGYFRFRPGGPAKPPPLWRVGRKTVPSYLFFGGLPADLPA